MMWTEFPLVEGETIQRRVKSTYLTIAEKSPPRDFSTIPQLRNFLAMIRTNNDVWRRQYIHEALTHLENAENEALPLNVRNMHFDIAGAKVWQLEGAPYSDPTLEYIRLFIQAKGV